MPVTTPASRSGRATPVHVRMEADAGHANGAASGGAALQRPPPTTLPAPSLASRDFGLNGERDYREQSPPDGTETIAEWMEGSHRVIERKAGPGSDVEVTVINEDPHASNAFIPAKWTGKIHELEHGAEEAAHSLRHELGWKARAQRFQDWI
ncbi:hypothetical protein NLJ89_g12324 [Agrocybe chaxingu]|uniref:Uncharacterized protein n=1 Tax=Agrocybe chaxingu TaxID=84603 RepID=A0A9W8JV11_9AGAR|nr:hypothetical protein NLJ89_g12324 [Agrocybe chaxingu]